ncbi:Epsin domain [Macleaya cordata]|uniref:Epsin domain n=1 Tax=Macleaya cordata TaxID=56857 RepID=A0A200QDN6_MACCD|nr:Epsin domain [Macleaya cordata]
MDFMKVLDQTVLDATSNEPWGPHGSALAEIAQATKKFSDCLIIMNVLWTRLTDNGRNWRHVYKALAVIEYLVAHGSERAVDDIIERSFQISSLSSFKYVEPNGKDMGINIRKRAETILSLLSDKAKIQEVRDKAAANRILDSHQLECDQYGGLSGTKEGEMFKDSYKDRERFEEDEFGKSNGDKSRRGTASVNGRNNVKNESAFYGRERDSSSSTTSSTLPKFNQSDDTCGPISSQSSAAPSCAEDDSDDFNPRGTSTAEKAPVHINEVDLLGNLMDAPPPLPPPNMSTFNGNASAEVDLFSDTTFVSATPRVEAGVSSHIQANVDLFAFQPASHSASSSTVDFFAAPEPVLQAETKSCETEPISSQTVDPFAGVSVNSFGGSDLFGAFTSHTDQLSTEPMLNPIKEGSLENLDQKTSTESKPPPKKDSFKVKSGIWADTLSCGLIDLNITAPKKTNLADIGNVGGLSDGSHGRSGFTSTGVASGGDIFSTPTHQQQQHQQFVTRSIAVPPARLKTSRERGQGETGRERGGGGRRSRGEGRGLMKQHNF